jgi:hypothetical protein
MKSGLFFSSLLFLAILGCSKPNFETTEVSDGFAPMVFHTSLADTLPAKTFDQLQLSNKTVGIKVTDLSGLDVRYFEYEADADILINALSTSPFNVDGSFSDLSCRKLSILDLDLGLNPEICTTSDRPYLTAFLNKYRKNFEVYECVKSPLKHQLFIDRTIARLFTGLKELDN